jgi:hypothetical protein
VSAEGSLPHRRLLMGLAVLALLPLLSGCIAAAALVPVAAAAGMVGTNVRVRAATPVPRRTGEEGRVTVSPDVVLTDLTELPPPSGPIPSDNPWQGFIDYALSRANDQERADSALLDPAASSRLVERRLACPEKQPAVIVDLDEGSTPFKPTSAGLPSPGLAEGLAQLRQSGIVVLWLSQANANEVREVADALEFSGLDPTGRDPLLLIRHPEDRKQTLRLEANLDVCVIAIAGDQRSDFDELFDYLRDPDAAIGLEGMFGAGWFLTPPPFEPAKP